MTNIADIGLSLQTARGAAVSTPTFRVPLAGGNFAPERTNERNPENRRGRFPGPGYIVSMGAAGTPEFLARADWLGLALYAALGAKSVTGSSDPWTHTFTGPSGSAGNIDALLPYLTVWRNVNATIYEQIVDCKVTRCEIVSARGRPVRVRVGLIGITPKSRTTLVTGGTWPLTTATFKHHHGRGALLVEGAAVSAIDEWSLTINTGVSRIDMSDVPVLADGPADVVFSAGQIVTSAALWNRFHYGSATPANATAAVRTVASLASGVDFLLTLSATRSLRLVLPNLELVSVNAFEPEPRFGPVRQNVIYRAVRPLGSSTALVTATLRNGTASY